MPTDAFTTLSLISATAILTNACAILQNGATTRYNLAITQWREFCASLATHDDRLALLYVDPDRAMALAERRIHLQLRALSLLGTAVALFASATGFGLIGALLVPALTLPAGTIEPVLVVTAAAALLAMLVAIGGFFLEARCGCGMLRLHPPAKAGSASRGPIPATPLGPAA